ncbi:MAG TPA: hypothetical protein PK170_08700, partial [Anaerolineae bacterium]|nr:hypothetical protein [Anaerolineae bacterium]
VEYTAHPANQPIGVAKGAAPGRVVWTHDPLVTTWNGTATGAGQRWYDLVEQTRASRLMSTALTSYASAGTPAQAWNAIFQNFNGGAGYQAGEKVFIKVNLTTSYSNGCADANYNWTITCLGGGTTGWTYIGQSPQLMIALLDQLVNVVGVAQSNITIGDSTGLWVNELYNPVHNAFPNVVYMDARGGWGARPRPRAPCRSTGAPTRPTARARTTSCRRWPTRSTSSTSPSSRYMSATASPSPPRTTSDR